MWLIYYKVYEKKVLIKEGNVIFDKLSYNLNIEKDMIIKSINCDDNRQFVVVIKNMCEFHTHYAN